MKRFAPPTHHVASFGLVLTLLSLGVGTAPGAGSRENAAAAEHTIVLLDRHDHALDQRLALIDRAARSIDISTFIIEEDPIALDIVWHLREATRRGVRVRLLVDAQFHSLRKPLLAHLVAEGIEIRFYHPFRWYKPGWLNTRLHDKILLVDVADREHAASGSASGRHESEASPLRADGFDHGAIILGGRNLSQPYFGIAGRLPRPYVDRDLLVRGPVNHDAAEYYQRLWSSRQTRSPQLGRWHPKRLSSVCDRHSRASRQNCRNQILGRDHRLAELAKDLDAVHASTSHPSPETAPLSFAVDHVSMLSDPVGDKDLDLPILHRLFQQPDRIGPQLLEIFDAAKHTVVIESPYLVPSRGFRKAVTRARERGIDLRVLTNSLLTTDNLFPQAAYRNAQAWLLDQGVELWEYAGSESMHAKSAVLDDRISIVGSYNLDPRSEHLNTEIALVIDDPSLAQALTESMDSRLASSWHITKDGIANRPGDLRYPGVERRKILLMTLLRAVTPLLKRQI